MSDEVVGGEPARDGHGQARGDARFDGRRAAANAQARLGKVAQRQLLPAGAAYVPITPTAPPRRTAASCAELRKTLLAPI